MQPPTPILDTSFLTFNSFVTLIDANNLFSRIHLFPPQRLVVFSQRPGFRRSPCLDIFEFNQDWSLHSKQRCLIEGLNYMHDFCLVPDYYIVHMTPFVKVSTWLSFKIASGWTSSGETMRHYPELPSKFFVIPRDQSHGNGIIAVDTGHFHVRYSFSCNIVFYSNDHSIVAKCIVGAICGYQFSCLRKLLIVSK